VLRQQFGERPDKFWIPGTLVRAVALTPFEVVMRRLHPHKESARSARDSYATYVSLDSHFTPGLPCAAARESAVSRDG
jgi:hypothetical protein